MNNKNKSNLITPELTPSDFLRSINHRGIPESRIYNSALGACIRAVSDIVLAEEFKPTEVPAYLRSELERKGIDRIVEGAAREEIQLSYLGTSLLDAYGIYKPNDSHFSLDQWQGPLLLPVDPDFTKNLFDQVGNLNTDFSVLSEMHDVYKETKILELLRYVVAMNNEESETATHSIDELYGICENAVFNEDFTLPLEHDDMTYFLCFVPHYARRIFKQIMISNQVEQRTSHILGELDKDEAEIFNNMKIAMKSEALIGKDWQQNLTRFSHSNDTVWRMANYAAQGIDALSKIQRMLDAGIGNRVIEAYMLADKQLNQSLDAISKRNDSHIFANSDIGHGLNLFNIYSFKRIGIGDWFCSEISNIEKDGTVAVIFEDDSKQAELWRTIVNNHSPQITSEADIYDNASEYLLAVNNPNVGLFIIDIEDANGDPIGIDLATEIIRRKTNKSEHGEDDTSGDFRLILWSSSMNRVIQASNSLKDILYSTGVNYSNNGTGSSRGSNSEVIVKHKTPDMDDFYGKSR